MKLLKEKRAQGSIEYLMIIGGVVLVAAIVGLYLKSIANTTAAQANTTP